jgi:hypothetical protein
MFALQHPAQCQAVRLGYSSFLCKPNTSLDAIARNREVLADDQLDLKLSNYYHFIVIK